MNYLELINNLWFCVLPLEEKERFTVTASSNPTEVGEFFEFPKNYEVYLVNNSEHDIETVKMLSGGHASDGDGVLETSRTIKEFKLPKKEKILVETIDYGLLDFMLWYWFDLSLGYPGTVKIAAGIAKAYALKKEIFKDVPVLGKKAYVMPIDIRLSKTIDEETKGMNMESRYIKDVPREEH